MKAVVLAFEDHYFPELLLLIRRLRRDLDPSPLVLEGRTVNGTGGFGHEVPRLLRTPLKQKESLLVASPEALLEYAATRGRRDAVQALLDGCRPAPDGLADEAYRVHYRSPAQCMDRVLQAIEGRRYKKGRDDEDLLRDHVSRDPGRRARVLRRCPELGRLLALLGAGAGLEAGAGIGDAAPPA